MKQKSITAQKKVNLIFYIAFMAIPVIQFLIFYVGVNFKSLMFTFQKYNYESMSFVFCGLENFKKVFSELFTNYYGLMFKNTCVAVFINIIVSTPLALLFSNYIYKKAFCSGFFRIILFLPTMISAVVLTLLFRYYVERFIPGIIEILNEDAKFPYLLSDDRYQFGTLIVYSILISFGSTTLLYSSAMSGIADSVVEAAQIDGANDFQEFIYIVFPMVYSTFSTFMIMTFAGIMTNQLNIYTFFGQSSVIQTYNQTLGYELYKRTVFAVDTNQKNMFPILSTYGVAYSFFTIPLTLFVRWLLNKIGPKVD